MYTPKWKIRLAVMAIKKGSISFMRESRPWHPVIWATQYITLPFVLRGQFFFWLTADSVALVV